MRPSRLPRNLPRIVQGGELRHRRWRTGKQQRPEKAGVDAIVLEILVESSKILRAVADGRTAKRTRVDHGGRTRNVFHGWGSANSGTKDVLGGLGNGNTRHANRLKLCEQSGSYRARII